MQSQYQSLLGIYEPLDILETNSLVVHKDALIEGALSCSAFTLPTNAGLGLVLTSDAIGNGTWVAEIKHWWVMLQAHSQQPWSTLWPMVRFRFLLWFSWTQLKR